MTEEFRMFNEKNSQGSSTNDLRVTKITATLATGEATLAGLKIKPGANVKYLICKKAQISDNNELVVNNAAIADDEEIDILIFSSDNDISNIY